MAGNLLHQKAVVLAKIESTYNTDPTPTATADAVLVEDPQYTVDPNVLARNFARPDLSQLPHKIGRKLAGMSFMVEAGSNGVANAGVNNPMLGVLLRACGFSETAIAASANGIQAVKAHSGNDSYPTWAVAGDETITEPIRYDIEVTTGGASGAAEVSITPDQNAVANLGQAAQTGVTVTSGAALDLKSGGSGFTAAPTFTGDLVVGDKWTVYVYPTGFLYEPVSSAFESVTLYAYFDGLLHKMTGARGSVSFEATAGEYGKFTFNFSGQYVAPVDAPMPVSGLFFDQQDPPCFEQARLYLDTFPAVVNSLSWDIANNVVPRSDANGADGYNGVRISGREPTGGIDPEATLVADEDFWGKMAASTGMSFRCRIGSTPGSKIFMVMPYVQYTGLSYQDRDNLRAFDAGLGIKRLTGNDELAIFFG